MSTILIDRRTAVLLGELAASEPTATPPRGAARTASRHPVAPLMRPVGIKSRPERRPVAVTRPIPAVQVKNSRTGTEVTVRRPARGGTSVRRSLKCRPTWRAARVAAEAAPRRAATAGSSSRKPSLHLTRRGRLVLLLLLLVLVTLAFSVGRVTSTALGAAGGAGEEVVVEQGDTLWSIAERVAPDSDPRTVVNDLMVVNGLESPSLEIGQHLRLR